MLKRIKIKKKEIGSILAASLILSFVISLLETLEIFLYTLLAIFIIISINILGKKIAAYYYDSEIEIKLWEIKRYWYKAHFYFQKPFPIGIIFPIITTVFSLGWIKWMACLTFDPKTPIYKAARRHDKTNYSFSEITEWQTGIIAIVGLAANLAAGIIGMKIGLYEFAKLNILYAFYNTIPISDLDGTKIFFAHQTLWAVSAAVLLAAVFLII